MQAHIKTARAHAAISYFYIVVAALACAFPYLVLTNAEPARMGEVMMASIFPLIFFCLFVLHQLVARGARQHKNWARITTIVIGIISVFGFPVGTIIGIYLLVNSSWTGNVTAS